MDRKSDDGLQLVSGEVSVPEPLARLLGQIEERVAAALARKYEGRPNGDEKIARLLPDETVRETEFVRRVYGAYERWSKEEDPVVLWDVDDTMGKAAIRPGNTFVWVFRPSFFTTYSSVKGTIS